MSDRLACARARETEALQWLDQQEWREQHPAPSTEDDLFGRSAVVAGFEAGVNQAEAEFAIERATGQQQLDDAWALMAESAALFLGYAEHHQRRADALAGSMDGDTDPAAQMASLQKARVNLLAALRLKEWMAGLGRYTVSPGEDTMACRAEPFPIPAVVADNGDLVPVDTKRRSNIRPVTAGPMADPLMIDSLVQALGGPAHSLSSVKAAGFSLQTGDPRFDPAEPVLINGYRFTPATEA